MMWNGQFGNKIYNVSRWQGRLFADNSNYIRFKKGEEPYQVNPNSNTPRIIYGDFRNSRDADRFLENGSYFRMKNISIGYNFRQDWLKNLGVEKLRLFATGSNLMAKLLKDPKLVECFVVVDTQMTPTAKFADYLLPDVAGQENDDFSGDSYSVGGNCYLIAMHKAVEPRHGQKRNWDIMRELAKRFGVEDKYTEGKTYDQWLASAMKTHVRKCPNCRASSNSGSRASPSTR